MDHEELLNKANQVINFDFGLEKLARMLAEIYVNLIRTGMPKEEAKETAAELLVTMMRKFQNSEK